MVRSGPSLEQQVKTLESCGITLRPEIKIEHLLTEFDREQYEREPFVLLLPVMGGKLADEPFGYLSKNIWHFDTECIEDHGDYAAIAYRMSELAGGDLPLEGISDYVDVEAEEAWLEFMLDGQKVRWEAKVEDDWVDTDVFTLFYELLEERQTGKRYTYFNLGGQDCLVGCCTPAQLTDLKKETGLNFQWLVEEQGN